MGSGGVAIAALPTVICLKVPFSDGLGGKTVYALTGIYVFYRSAPWLKAITTTRLFDLINKNSFGIYLFHPIIIYLLFYIFGDLPVNPYLLTALVFLTSTAASILLTGLVRRKNMGVIIGEKPIA